MDHEVSNRALFDSKLKLALVAPRSVPSGFQSELNMLKPNPKRSNGRLHTQRNRKLAEALYVARSEIAVLPCPQQHRHWGAIQTNGDN